MVSLAGRYDHVTEICYHAHCIMSKAFSYDADQMTSKTSTLTVLS